jgi:hypothetical protein
LSATLSSAAEPASTRNLRQAHSSEFISQNVICHLAMNILASSLPWDVTDDAGDVDIRPLRLEGWHGIEFALKAPASFFRYRNACKIRDAPAGRSIDGNAVCYSRPKSRKVAGSR